MIKFLKIGAPIGVEWDNSTMFGCSPFAMLLFDLYKVRKMRTSERNRSAPPFAGRQTQFPYLHIFNDLSSSEPPLNWNADYRDRPLQDPKFAFCELFLSLNSCWNHSGKRFGKMKSGPLVIGKS